MAKLPIYQHVRNPSDASDDKHQPESTPHVLRRPWQPGFFRRLPWLGVVCILLALGCAAAAVGIAIQSDGQPLDRWTVGGYEIQPAVLLSIVATVGNALLVYAFTQGATVHWYVCLMEGHLGQGWANVRCCVLGGTRLLTPKARLSRLYTRLTTMAVDSQLFSRPCPPSTQSLLQVSSCQSCSWTRLSCKDR